MKNFIKRLISDQTGATAIEYGLILGLIVLALLSGLQAFADRVAGKSETEMKTPAV